METTTKSLIALGTLLILLGVGSLALAAEVQGPEEPNAPESPEGWYYVLTYNAGQAQTILHVATVSDKDTEQKRSTNTSETPEGLPRLEAVIILLPFDASAEDLGTDPLSGLNTIMATKGDALAYFRARSRMSGEDFELGLPSQLPNANGELITIGSAVMTSTLTREMTVIGPSGIRQWDAVMRAECAKWAEDCSGAGWQSREVPVMKAG